MMKPTSGDSPKCPYCGYIVDNPSEWPNDREGEQDFKCPGCKKLYSLAPEVEVTWYGYPSAKEIEKEEKAGKNSS